jgi:phage terminase large subunit-like protein
VKLSPAAAGMFGDLFNLGPEVIAADDPLADALEALAKDPAQADPLARLFDPTFTDTTWEYEGSRLDTPFLPGQLHEKQLHALHAPHRFKWLFWGNQVGKTTEGAVETVLYALGRHPRQLAGDFPMPPVTFWASALTWELWENVLLPEILTWIPRARLLEAPEPYRQSTKRTIRILADNGKVSRITGKAAEQGAARYQSSRLHGAWLDEEHPESVYDELQPRLLRFGGVLLNTMSPLKGLTWVFHRIYEPWKKTAADAKGPMREHYVSHAGLEDNPGIPRESIETLKRELRHNPAQLAARLHGLFMKPTGRVLDFNEDRHFAALKVADVERLLRLRHVRAFAGVDFGAWRFAFNLWITDEAGGLVLVDELFLQRGAYDDEVDPATKVIRKKGRARAIHDVLHHWNVPTDRFLGIGDCANPQDIIELNAALMRIESPYRFGAVHANHKIIAAGVDRVANLLANGGLHVRRGIGAGQVWYLGQKAGVQGKPIEGSRWLWEVDNWLYPKTDDDKAQRDVPDDHTADGADQMAATRYVVMTYFAAEGPPKERKHPSVEEREWANQRGEPLPDDEPPEYETFDDYDMVQEG